VPSGFTIIEILVSLAIFSTVILALVGLTFQVTRKSIRATDQTLIMGTLLSEVDKAAVLPFDSLPSLAGCRSFNSYTYTVTRCVSVTALSARADSIRIVVRTSIPGTRPDTVAMVRARPRTAIPLR